MSLTDTLTPIALQVNYGPGYDGGPRTPYWYCNRCCQGVSGCRNVEHAKGLARDHANTHAGVRAVYYEGPNR